MCRLYYPRFWAKNYGWLFIFSFALFSCDPHLLTQSSGSQKQQGQSKYNFTELEAEGGIREALYKGVREAVAKVSQTDGFLGNNLIRIPFPQEFSRVEESLKRIGMGSLTEQAVTSMNRAAEDASREAIQLFGEAIRGLSIQDAFQLLTGGENAATDFLRQRTEAQLRERFEPVISQSLDKVNATRHWSSLTTRYNQIPMVQPVNSDLTSYVNEKAIEGLFKMVALEEEKIRKDPLARTNDLLKKVFGNL